MVSCLILVVEGKGL